MAIKDLPPPIKTPDSEKGNWSQLLDWLVLVWKFVRTPALVLSPSGDAPTTPTGTPGDASTQIANDAFVAAALAAQQASASNIGDMYGMSGVEGGLLILPPPLAVVATVYRGHIFGFILAPSSGSTSMPISAGQVADSTNSVIIALNSAMTKTTASWAVGSGNGGKLSAAAFTASTWYYFFAIYRADTGVIDIGFDVSPTSPTLPTNYTNFRYIGANFSNGSSQWSKITQTGPSFVWDTPIADFSGVGSATASLLTCTIPKGRKMQGQFNIGSTNSTSMYIYISDPDNSDLAPSSSAAPGGSAGIIVSGGSAFSSSTLVWTNTSAQIRHRENNTNSMMIVTLGWLDYRDQY